MPHPSGGYEVVAVDLAPGDWVRDRHGGFEVSALELAQGRVQVLATDGSVRSYHWNEILAYRPSRAYGPSRPRQRFGDEWRSVGS